MRSYYVQTSDPARVIRIPSTGYASVVPDNLSPGVFSLTNNLTRATMAEARTAAKSKGLRLRDVRVMATREEEQA